MPWNVYSLTGIAIIAGLTHVPHVLPLLVVGAEEPRLRRRGSGAHGRLEPVPGRQGREPADGDAVAAVLGRAGLLPRLRDLRPAARARRSGGPPRARDLSLQAHQQARHAVVPPDGRGRGVHRRDDLPARHAAALPAEERRQVRHRQGQGRPAAAAAARRLALGRRGDPRPLALRDRRRAALGDRAARASSPTGARASTSPTCSRSTTSARCSRSRRWCAASSTRC